MVDATYGYAGYATWLRQIRLRWLRQNTVTPHGYAGYAIWSCQIRLRHNSVSTESTTCCVGCAKVMTWHSACIKVVHGM